MRRSRWAALVLAVALGGGGAAAAVAWQDTAGTAALPAASPSASAAQTAGPAAAPSQPALGPLPSAAPVSVEPAFPPAGAGSAPPPTPTGLRRLLAPLLARPSLGRAPAAVVLDATTGDVLFGRSADRPATPASTAKVVVAAAALDVLDPATRFETTVVRGRDPGSVVLAGGGDPTLTTRRTGAGPRAPASLRTLAGATAAALRAAGTTSVRLGFDASLFGGPRVNPFWEPHYVPTGDVAPVTALAVDGGRLRLGAAERAVDPPRAAARRFAGMLRGAGVEVRGRPRPARAPAGSERLAAVASPPLEVLVEQMLTTSDNDQAEVLARQAALGAGEPGTFAGARTAVADAMARLGLDPFGVVLLDGSGLARGSEVPPLLLADVLRLAAGRARPDLRSVITGLPVAGFTGTLAERLTARPARPGAGVVRAKTGTLTGVTALAGTVVTRSGWLLAFAFMADRVPPPATLDARAALDRMAAVLAGCGCR